VTAFLIGPLHEFGHWTRNYIGRRSLDNSSDKKLVIIQYLRGYMHRWRPGAEFGGTGKNFADQRFLNEGNKFHFHAQKFLMTFF